MAIEEPSHDHDNDDDELGDDFNDALAKDKKVNEKLYLLAVQKEEC